MKDRVVISPTTRQEGHAELVMEVDDQGIVTKGMYLSITPVRGLEKMVLDKAPESAPVLYNARRPRYGRKGQIRHRVFQPLSRRQSLSHRHRRL